MKNLAGAGGIRSEGLLRAAFARPFQTFDQQNYATPVDKAAATASSGEIRYDEIKLWIEEYLVSVNV